MSVKYGGLLVSSFGNGVRFFVAQGLQQCYYVFSVPDVSTYSNRDGYSSGSSGPSSGSRVVSVGLTVALFEVALDEGSSYQLHVFGAFFSGTMFVSFEGSISFSVGIGEWFPPYAVTVYYNA